MLLIYKHINNNNSCSSKTTSRFENDLKGFTLTHKKLQVYISLKKKHCNDVQFVIYNKIKNENVYLH